MNVFINKNSSFISILIELLFLSFYYPINSNDCETHSFPELNYPKAMTLSNEYKVMITMNGIYSFYPKLSTIAYSYNFTEEQKIPEEDSISYVYKADISQFSGEDGENRYVLCLINHFLYIMDEKGKMIFSKNITSLIDKYKYYSLVPYKYSNNSYYFIIGYKMEGFQDLKIIYLKMLLEDNNIEINKIFENQYKPDGISFITSENISCQKMKSSTKGNVITCFIGSSFVNLAISFNPDNNLTSLFKSNELYNSDEENINFIKTAINNEKNKAFFCYIANNLKGKCIYYDINKNILNKTNIETSDCTSTGYGLNVYFFEKANEFIFSCLDSQNKFLMKRIDLDFNLIDDDNIFNGKQFLNCKEYSEFSIVYISQYNQYSLLIDTNCDGNSYVKFFMLSNTICKMPSGEKEDDNVEIAPETTIITTIPEIETTMLEITTISEITTSNIITTLPEIETTTPEIITSSPKIETIISNSTISSLPEIETTIPEITSTSPQIDTTFPSKIISSFPEIEKTLQYKIIPETNNIIEGITTSFIIDTTQITKSTNYSNESLCKEIGKIYSEGKCICDIYNDYYSINSKSSENKCYKKSELPKNLYLNDTTKVYEVCYKTCETCNKGGNYSENNCLTCASNYIKESEKNSLNCVEKCKYLYYYNSLNQYSCTEDEQCPNESSLIIRQKKKCINKCSNDDTYIFQYNGQCLISCPVNTEPKELNICQESNVATCSSSDFKLNLEETIDQDNVKLVAKNYASEFFYTLNHVSRFWSQNFTMVLYKNSSCIDELKLNVTKIEYDSCINQLKKDNNIDESKELIIAVIDILNGDKKITSFGFFNPENGEKLDAAKSCSDKSVMMYENILNILNEPLGIKLLKEQKINIFDLNGSFYNDICFHFESPNGKDSTLQDRIKTFYPNITLCDSGCKNKGINFTSMEAQCECTFQDLLSKNIFQNDLIGDNVLIKEALGEIMEMLSNLNIDVLICFKDIFDFSYFKKNIGEFIILGFILTQTICVIYYYSNTNYKLVKYIYSFTETYIITKNKTNKSLKKKTGKNNNPPKKIKTKKEKENNIKKDKKKNIKNKNNDKKEKKYKSGNEAKNINQNKSIIASEKKDKKKNFSKFKNKERKKLKIINSSNISKKSNDFLISNNQNSLSNINNYDKNEKIIIDNKDSKPFKLKGIKIKYDFHFINKDIDFKNYLEPTLDSLDYDEIIEEDKRSFCEYLGNKLSNIQIIINVFFVSEEIKPKVIKIIILILNFDLYFLINGLFYSESYISEIFNSTEEETLFSFIPRSIDRFVYSTIVGNIIEYIIKFFLVEEIEIKKILLKKRENILSLRYEMSELLKNILNKIKIFIIINYIIVVFSWYYITCFNNVYPNIKYEWITSSIFIIIIVQILPFIFALLETCIRFISIKCESEKLFKLSLLFP